VIGGLSERSELNGEVGVVAAWNDVEQRWLVQLDNGSRKLCRTQNLHVTSMAQLLASLVSKPPQQGTDAQPVPPAPPQSMKYNGVRGLGVRGLTGEPVSCSESDGPPISEISRLSMAPRDLLSHNFGVNRADSAPSQPFSQAGASQGSSNHLASAIAPAMVQSPISSTQMSQMSQLGQSSSSLMPSLVQVPTSPPMISEPAPRSVTAAREAPAVAREADVTADFNPQSDGVFAPGVRVRIEGVKSQSLQALNGQRGTVIMHEEKSGTWKVRLDGGSKKLFKTFHLRCLQDEEQIEGVSAVQVPPSEEQAMNAKMTATEDRIINTLRRENLVNSATPAASDNEIRQDSPTRVAEEVITAGTRICVFGLRSRPELNGKLGAVQTTVADSKNRWKVRMDDGEKILLGHVNFEVVAD
jgi:hypothetical protein